MNARPAAARRILSSRLAWLAVLIVAGVALGIGSVHPVPATKAQRIGALENEIKCPSCADLSIAQSQAAAAIDLRAEVTRMVDAGASDPAIRAEVVRQYGSAVLLVPTGSGVGVLVFALPAAAVVLCGAGLAVFLWRRRRAPGAVGSSGGEEDELLVAAARAAPGDPGRSLAVAPGRSRSAEPGRPRVAQ